MFTLPFSEILPFENRSVFKLPPQVKETKKVEFSVKGIKNNVVFLKFHQNECLTSVTGF